MVLKSEVNNMSPKMGRPIIGEPKSNDIKVRVDNAMHNALLKYCEKNGITKAEAIRQALKLFLK